MKNSIKRQIILAVVISQLLLATLLTVVIVLYSRSQLLTGFDVMLEGRADSVFAVIHDSEEVSGTLLLDSKQLRLPNNDLLELWDDHGDLIWRSKNWRGAPANAFASASHTFRLKIGPSSYRGIVVRKAAVFDVEDNRPGPMRTVTIAYASPTDQLEKRILEIGLFATGASLLLLLLTGLFAAYGVVQGLSPMQDLAVQASRVSVRNWGFHPPSSARRTTELAPLVNALETALSGLERAFTREREFMADAAHELKTATAILKSSLQLLLFQPRSNADYKSGVEHALDDCDRIETLVHSTLNLARAEHMADGGRSEDFGWVDLAHSCEQSVVDVQPLAQARGVKMLCTFNHEAMVKANPLDLRTIWVNLLQNAIQHSPPGSTVSVSVNALKQNTATVMIEDRGSGIPSEQLTRVFDRFYRSDPSRSRVTGGVGLGLSICKTLVEAYGGLIQITSSSGAGTRVTVTLSSRAPIRSEKDPHVLSQP